MMLSPLSPRREWSQGPAQVQHAMNSR